MNGWRIVGSLTRNNKCFKDVLLYQHDTMKSIEIIIPEDYLKEINNILRDHLVGGMNFQEIKGIGAGRKPELTIDRGTTTIAMPYWFRYKIEALVSDSTKQAIIQDILKLSNGSKGQGKVFVYDVAEAYDIGSKEQGDKAL